MKLNIKKELLLKAVNINERNVGRNLTLPILNNILIRANENKVEIISTDLDIAIITELTAKTEESGSIVIPPKTLSGFLSNLPDSSIELKKNKETLFLKNGTHKTSIKGENDKDFPLLPKVYRDNYFTVKAKDIVSALDQVINSVSSSELKPELTGILFNITKNEFKLASTDSFRLSERKVPFDNISAINNKKIIPAKTANEIIRSYQNIEGELIFYIEDNQLTVENKDNNNFKIRIISKFIEGDYPDYSKIIPNNFTTKVIVSKKDLLQQVKGASLFTSRVNDIRLSVNQKKIDIHAENYDVGEFNSSVTVTTTGESKELVFNHQYLIDGLNNIEGDEIIIKINKADGPTMFESTDYKNYFYILMPIRH
ncbi:MAG: DNA polymerase III subunit beta [Candidatus Spechtbacterales bacterium]|nr:DNA polymerase III subunit beta [Candidatus Spechtbacterales bacterium]